MSRNLLAVLGIGLVDPSTPVLRADDAGATRGDGCFECIRVISDARGTRAAKIDRHLARMSRSAAALDIAFDPREWAELVQLGCAAWIDEGDGEAALKLVLTRGTSGPTGFLTISARAADYPRQRREGIRVSTLDRGLASDAFAAAPWLLGGVKTLSYAVNMAAQREAEARGVEDAIFVSADGFVLEAPTGSVVWTSGRQMSTTPVGATGILAGTTQQLLFDAAAQAGWQTSEQLVGVDDLHRADSVWVVSSVRGPVDVIEIDGVAHARHLDLVTEITSLAGF